MRIVKDHSGDGTPAGSFETDFCTDGFSLLFRAIENADGVPFQLIFGPRIGEGYFLNLGAGIKQLLDIPSEDFTEKLYYEMMEEIVPTEDIMPPDPAEIRRKIINGEIPAFRAELLVRLPGGGKKWIRESSLPVTDRETGHVIGAFGIINDIDEYKKSQLTILQASERAGEYDRLKSAFIRNISHEIRNPLNVICD